MSKDLVISLNKSDFKVEYFKASGPGGQNKNKRATACRIKHPASGAVAEAKEGRTQVINRRKALDRLSKTKEFILWAKIVVSQSTSICEEVEKMMSPENLKIEVFRDGEWYEVIID